MTAKRIALLAATFVLGTGCMHARNLSSCTPGTGESECWQSSRADASGTVREQVVERVTPAGDCDQVEVERTAFDGDGMLRERTIETRRCAVVEQRTVERYDWAGEALVVESFADRDHDDHFEDAKVERTALTAERKAFALAER
jgi:hypothetical protein